MAKKNKTEGGVPGRKVRSGREPFEFLSVRFENLDVQTVKRHLFFLVLASLLTKLIVMFATTTVFHSFIDYFDLGFYFDHATLLLQGQLPYINYSFDYPVLIFIPITLALIPALVLQSAMAFVYTFQLLMVVCDIVTSPLHLLHCTEDL